MNLAKSELKIAHTQAWVDKLSDLVSGASGRITQLRGSLEGVKQGQKALEGHKAVYDKELDEGKITAEECVFAKRVVDRCIGSLISLGETAISGIANQNGCQQAYQKTLDMLNKELMDEAQKAKFLLDAIDRGEITVEDAEGGARVLATSLTPKERAKKSLRERRQEAADKRAAEAASANGDGEAASPSGENPAGENPDVPELDATATPVPETTKNRKARRKAKAKGRKGNSKRTPTPPIEADPPHTVQ